MPIYLIILVYGVLTYAQFHVKHFSNRFTALSVNPVKQVFNTYLLSFNKYNKKIKINEKNLANIRLTGKEFTFGKPDVTLPSAILPAEKMNVVILVLESVAKKYIFAPTANNKIPMPFLKKLSTQGVWFENHYTTGNISAFAQFSMFTGIYPSPRPGHFEMRNDLFIPTLPQLLSNDYDSFFISSSNDFYYAIGINKTFANYVNALHINPKAKLFYNMFIDEREGFNYFLNRIRKAHSPFVGVYWTGAAHFPYRNYSAVYKIVDDIEQTYSRYINSLFLLDHEIEQTFALLSEKKLLDKTIFVVIGDHGELFGQHQNFYLHGQTLFQEEVHVPLLIYSPKIFKPRRFFAMTSHIDLLPILLRALKVTAQNKLQGDAVLSKMPDRKYIFIYNDEDEIAAISPQKMKMLISFAEATCVTYDLKRDEQEKFPLPCRDLAQQTAILQFRNYQPRMLNWYNHRNFLAKHQL